MNILKIFLKKIKDDLDDVYLDVDKNTLVIKVKV